MVEIMDSILNSVKKSLGIFPDDTNFDTDILININGAISILNQIGVELLDKSEITSEEDTYSSFFGDNTQLNNLIRSYLYHKVRLSFDPPISASVLECLKEMVREEEWRINAHVDPPNSFI